MSAAYTVSCIEGGVRDLNALISVICEIQFELPRGENDERINCLLWIARDLSEGVVECHEREVREGAGRARP